MLKRLNLSFTGVLYAAAAVVLVFQLGIALSLYAGQAAAAVNFPYPLDYGEGPILDQVVRMARAENIYRAGVSAPPYTISNYPPLFHVLQLPFAWLAGPAFWYGRVLSIVSAILAALFIGLIVHAVTKDLAASVISGALLLAFPYIMLWSTFDRVDTLALAFSLAGLYAIIRWPDHRRGVILAVILFAAAVYTRQSYWLVGPGTALAWLAQNRRYKQAALFGGGLAGTCLALFLLLNWTTGGGFFFNLVTANVNRLSYIGFMANVTGLFINAWILVLGAIGFLVVERWWYPTRSWPLVLPYVLLSAASMFLVGKAGASGNSLFEPVAALCLVAGALIAWPERSPLLKAVVLVLLAVQINTLIYWSRTEFLPITAAKLNSVDEVAGVAKIVRESPGPVLLDEFMGLAPLAGKPIFFQPFEFMQLQAANLWEPDALVAAIERREFSTILLYEPNFGPPMIVSRWSPQIREAIWRNYSASENLAGTWVYIPNSAANK